MKEEKSLFWLFGFIIFVFISIFCSQILKSKFEEESRIIEEKKIEAFLTSNQYKVKICFIYNVENEKFIIIEGVETKEQKKVGFNKDVILGDIWYVKINLEKLILDKKID